MAQPDPKFCPFCAAARPNDSSPCPRCKNPSIQEICAKKNRGGALSIFGDDIEALSYDEATGEWSISPDKDSVKWQWQTGQIGGQFPFTLSANQQTRFTVRINPEEGMRGDTEICAMMMTTTDRVAILPYIPVLDKYLANALIPSSLICGTAQLPALWPQSVYSLPGTLWQFDVKELGGVSNTVSPVLFGRRFLDRGKERLSDVRRAALFSKFMHPYWLGPTSAFDFTTNSTVSVSPTVSIPTGDVVTVTFSVPSTADFDCKYILDDSSTSGGANTEINDLLVFMTEGGSARGLIDVPRGSNGLSWRNFVASPTVPVTGFPSGGTNSKTGGIRAASVPSPVGGWSHLFKRGTDIQVTYKNTDAGTVTLRTAFVGTLIYANEGIDDQRVRSAGDIQNDLLGR